MFDLGIIAARRSRSASDRSTYRLIGGLAVRRSPAPYRRYAIIYCRKTAACAAKACSVI